MVRINLLKIDRLTTEQKIINLSKMGERREPEDERNEEGQLTYAQLQQIVEPDTSSSSSAQEIMVRAATRARPNLQDSGRLHVTMFMWSDGVQTTVRSSKTKRVEKPVKPDSGNIFQLDQCCICLSAKPTIRASPCGHVFACAHCAACYLRRIEKQPCPICRELINCSRSLKGVDDDSGSEEDIYCVVS